MRYFNRFAGGKLSLCAFFVLMITSANARNKNFYFNHPLSDTTKKDSAKYEEYKSLPLKPARRISFTTNEGSWMSVDVSPDGQTIIFDMMGDLYTVPITGGKATQLTKGLAYDVHPRYSPDGKKILFISDRSGADNVWCFDTEKKDTIQLTSDNNKYFPDCLQVARYLS